MPRRSPAHRTAVGAALALALALAGCAVSPEPEPTPTKTATAPIFASDEEALAAAELAFGEFLALADQISAEGGVEPERIYEVASGDEAEDSLVFFERLRDENTHLEGQTKFDSARLQEVYQADGLTNVSIYLCIDVGDTKVISAEGEDVTQKDRKLRIARTAVLVGDGEDASSLRVDRTERWPGDDFC